MPTAPDLYFPMDELDPTWYMDSGRANFTKGKVGNGLDGPRVMIGRHGVQECFANTDYCPDGVTLAMWVFLRHPYAPDNWIFTAQRFGMLRHFDPFLQLFIRDGSQIHKDKITFKLLNTWAFIAFTWNSGEESKIYINGCPSEVGRRPSSFGLESMARPLVLGWGDNIIDELRYWYHILTAAQIKQLYIQGGRIDWETVCHAYGACRTIFHWWDCCILSPLSNHWNSIEGSVPTGLLRHVGTKSSN